MAVWPSLSFSFQFAPLDSNSFRQRKLPWIQKNNTVNNYSYSLLSFTLSPKNFSNIRWELPCKSTCSKCIFSAEYPIYICRTCRVKYWHNMLLTRPLMSNKCCQPYEQPNAVLFSLLYPACSRWPQPWSASRHIPYDLPTHSTWEGFGQIYHRSQHLYCWLQNKNDYIRHSFCWFWALY